MEISMANQYIILLNVRITLIVIIILFGAKCTKNNTKLSYNDHIIPLHYDVDIKFDVYTNIFFGKCNITIKINPSNQSEFTKNITMMSSGIFDIIEIYLIDINRNRTDNIQKFSFINETYNFFYFSISLVDFLYSGTYILKMIYARAILDDGDDSFEFYFEDKEVLKNKSVKVIFAEDLFPYWEKSIKSTFNISIYHDKNYNFLSNIPIRKKVEGLDNNMWTYFEKSPSMSAQNLKIVYLNTLFNSVHSTANIEFWCKRKEVIDQMQFAINIVEEVLLFLELRISMKKNLKINYIVTRDFQQGNTIGFILLREHDIIYNSTVDDIAFKLRVTNLIAYETIFQWFYDVPLWSKEGFVTFLTTYFLDKIQGGIMNLFAVQTQQESLRLDTLSDDSLPLDTANVSTVHSFRSSFHYIKSFVIWRILYHLIPRNVFWTGIRTYIDLQYNQSNALKIDALWNIMQTSDNPYNLDIQYAINIWIKAQNPYLDLDRDYSKNITALVLFNIKASNNTNFFSLMKYKTKSNENSFFWFDLSKQYLIYFVYINSTISAPNDWIILNLEQIGYYRVKYDNENWKNLAHYLRYENLTGIDVLNRAQIIDDAFYFLFHQQLNYTMFWNIISFLRNDADYIAWYPMIKVIEYMICILPYDNFSNTKHKIRELFSNLLSNIKYYDFINEHNFTKYLREEAIKWLCVLDDSKCRKIATIELEKHLQSSVQDKRLTSKVEWIYCKGLMAANQIIWKKVYKKWEETEDNTLLEYLTCSTDAEININYLMLAMRNIAEDKHLGGSNVKKWVNIVLHILAKHEKQMRLLEFVLDEISINHFGLKTRTDQTAILIVLITHDITMYRFKKVYYPIQKMVKNHLNNRTQFFEAVRQKIKRRKDEYSRQMEKYRSLIQ